MVGPTVNAISLCAITPRPILQMVFFFHGLLHRECSLFMVGVGKMRPAKGSLFTFHLLERRGYVLQKGW